MCAAFVGGLVAEAITVGCFYDGSKGDDSYISTAKVNIENTPITATRLTDATVDTILFNEVHNDRINLKYKGIGLTVSDTAGSVSVAMAEYWRGIIIPQLSGSKLTVEVNCDSLAARLQQAGQLPDFAVVKSDTFRLAEIIIPRDAAVPFIKAECRRTVYVDSLPQGSLTVNVPDRVVLNNCRLNSFVNQAGTFNQLKLDNSFIGRASLNGVRSRFNVECLNTSHDPSATAKSRIDTLAIAKVKSRPDFNFNKADIGVVMFYGTENK